MLRDLRRLGERRKVTKKRMRLTGLALRVSGGQRWLRRDRRTSPRVLAFTGGCVTVRVFQNLPGRHRPLLPAEGTREKMSPKRRASPPGAAKKCFTLLPALLPPPGPADKRRGDRVKHGDARGRTNGDGRGAEKCRGDHGRR